ncbi:MAG: DUF4349 domain-containing protein [Planctomycetaceae bacterium]|nr:DUF4349 domain-containing protein [Planctomycetaceae bacterium]
MATSRTVENYLTPPREQEPDKVETVERKIIKNGSIRFAAADVNETKSLITQTVQELKGYISDDNASGYSNRIEHRLIIRIPADKFDLLLNTISKRVNKLDDKKIEVLDVTEEYIDIEARTKTKKELQSRYAALLERAETVEDILRIEKEIGGLQTEIESVEGRMRYLKDRIAFSTLTVTYYQEIDEPASPFGFSSKFTEGIKNGWDNFLWFIIGLSHLWVFILLAVIIYFVRRWGKKYRSTN